jgi:hypothetical protein
MSAMYSSVGLLMAVDTYATCVKRRSYVVPLMRRRPPMTSVIRPLPGDTRISADRPPMFAFIRMSPFGVHSYAPGSYCQSPMILRGSPPFTSMTYSRLDASRLGLDTNEIIRLFGAHAMLPSLPGMFVSRRGVPPPMGSTKMSESLRSSWSRSMLNGSRSSESRSACTTESGRSAGSATNAIHRPSGETTALRCEYVVRVSCVPAVSPICWTQICAGS